MVPRSGDLKQLTTFLIYKAGASRPAPPPSFTEADPSSPLDAAS
jgi:hypothetical protein